jgi:hypothetical protein
LVKVIPKPQRIIFCLLGLLGVPPGCIAPPEGNVVDQSAYGDNLIDNALHTRRGDVLPADAIVANLRNMFPLGSSVSDVTGYLSTIGSQCNSSRESARTVTTCTYEKRRKFTRYKIEGVFFSRTTGAAIGEGSFMDHVEIRLVSSDGTLKDISVDYHIDGADQIRE